MIMSMYIVKILKTKYQNGLQFMTDMRYNL
jgi:hypothetical protein